MKKILALVLALLMVAGMVSAFAAGNTITVSGAVDGEKYNIYKMLDLDVGKDSDNKDVYRYTINAKWADFWTTGAGADYIDTNTAGAKTYVVWKDGKDTAAEMETFGKAAAAFAAANGIAPDATEVTATASGAEFTGLDNGYYLVTSTLGIAASVASTPVNPAETIYEKNEGNITEKEVEEAAERNGTAASWGTENDAAVGDTVNFRSEVKIAKNSINVKYHDTMDDGLTWTGADNVKVYTDKACTTEVDAAKYTVKAGTSPETFVVEFDDAYVATFTDAATYLYVAYSAVLNDNAVVESPELNTPAITWGNNGNYEGEPTETRTHKFAILKYDGADPDENPLNGAKFQLFTTETGGSALKLCVSTDGLTYRLVNKDAEIPTGFTLATDNKIVTTDSNTITVIGVDSDDYYLEETDAPIGFNKIDGRIKVEVNANNELLKKVVNNSGNTLPSTGGMGTTILYIAGSILVLGAVIFLVTKRRMKVED